LSSIAAGTVFQDRYEILSKVGEGGFSKVYRARHRVTGQEVAVKVLLHLHANDEGHVARFQREMRLCARLYHPNIVRLIDSGKTEQGQLYTVFEYVPGRTLGDVLASEGALPAWEAAHLMLQVLDALGCAHRLGVVHRDLKPQNLMLASTGVRRNALVLDFGLGTLTDEERKEDLARITRTQEMLGTPAYAAPEQLRGEAVTARADLYAWGLIFLECLTGKRALEAGTLHEVIFKQMSPEPITLPEWLQEHRLGRLLRRVLEKDPRARDVTAQSLLLELESYATQGWPSAGSAALQSLGDAPQGAAEGERRQLTVLSCGLRLVGRGTDAEELEELEELDALLWAQHAACAELARHREAWVGSILGERLLLSFGYPRAREDDAHRAVQLALELMAQLKQRGAELERTQGLKLEARIGIHTGLVISHELRGSGPGGAVLAGHTPGVAERLEALAGPGEVLVSAATAKLLREHFTLEPSGEHRVGVGMRSLPVFRVQGRSRTRPQGLEETPAGPLLGRTLELELLQQRWRQALTGMGQGILLTGEPGIGKSRLVQELAQQVRATPHTFLELRCAPEWRNSTLRPVVDWLERLLGAGRDWTGEQTTAALEALLSRHGFELAEAVPLFASLLSVKGTSDRYPPRAMSPERQKELILDALLTLIFEMAQQQPVLLAVEDLHWADPMTLELVTWVVKEAPTARLCVVLTARPEFSQPWPSAQVMQVQLGRLERQQVEEMVRRLTRDTPLPSEVVEQVVGRTDGVPLFVEELTRMVAESLPPGEEAHGRVLSPLAIPSTLRDSLMARLDRLGPAKATAQLAAALGREFTYELLEACSVADAETLKRDLETLVAAELIHRRRGARGPVHVFKHALIRDTAYESMIKPTRRQVHARIAVALELRFPELVQRRPELLARHHAAAEQKREALGYARQAALAALMRSAHPEALAHATEALGWLHTVPDEKERARVELELSGIITPALMATRGWADEAVKARVERSQALIDQLGDSPHVIPTLWALAAYHLLRGQHLQARALAERLVAMEGLARQASHQVVALPLLAACLCAEGRCPESRECATRALSLYGTTPVPPSVYMLGVEPRVYAMVNLGFVHWSMGALDEAAKVMQAALTLARELDHASTLAVAFIFALVLHHLREESGPFSVLAEQALELTSRQRLVSQGMYVQLLSSCARKDLEGMDRSLAALEAQGTALYLPFYGSMAADVEAALGRRDAAIERLEAGQRRARDSGEGFSLLHCLYRQGSLLLEREPGSALGEARLREGMALARERGARMLELRAALPLCRLLLQRGQRSEARELLASLYGQFTEGLDAPDLVRARTLLAELGG
jgi:TOMM system kinase/cyclase fusion protein